MRNRAVLSWMLMSCLFMGCIGEFPSPQIAGQGGAATMPMPTPDAQDIGIPVAGQAVTPTASSGGARLTDFPDAGRQPVDAEITGPTPTNPDGGASRPTGPSVGDMSTAPMSADAALDASSAPVVDAQLDGDAATNAPDARIDDAAQPPPQEICNGQDDDSDDVIDEGFGLGGPCNIGRGACLRDGVLACDAQGVRICVDENGTPLRPGLAQIEICNEIDDDCDGVVDDIIIPDEPCQTNIEGCQGDGEYVCNYVTQQLDCRVELPEACQCELATRGRHEYWTCNRPATQEQARQICQTYGADLVQIDTELENRFVGRLRVDRNLGAPWIGLSDVVEDGVFRWTSGLVAGTRLNGDFDNFREDMGQYARFSPYQPDDYREVVPEGESCVQMWEYEDNSWNDIHCTALQTAVCEAQCQPGQDDDGDGALRCGTDCDDNDARRYPDAPEVCFDGIDNNCNGQIDEGCENIGCISVFRGGQIYLFCMRADHRRNWFGAREYCRRIGMELSTPETLEENQFLWTEAAVHTQGERRPFWIGMVFDRATNRWQSDATGRPPQYEIPWAPNEPNQNAGLDCASLIADDPLWATVSCGATPRRFVCERSAQP